MLAAIVLTPALWAGIVQVEIKEFSFVPDTVRVQPGDTVRWTQKDGIPHTSTGTGTGAGAWDSGTLNQNQTYQRAFPTAGTFAYICDFHAMFGTVIVGTPAALRPGPEPKSGALPAAPGAGSRDARGRLVTPPAQGGPTPAFTPR